MSLPALIIVTAATWLSAWLCWSRFNETAQKRWVAAAIGCIAAGAIVYQSSGTAGAFYANADCYVDWDGRANRTVCD